VADFARVLDASALLAFMRGERGADRVEPLIDGAAISAVNWAETMQVLRFRQVADADWFGDLEALGIPVIPFTAAHANAAAELWGTTRDRGLALGDRACLAVALTEHVAAVTADSAWRDLELGIDINFVR
jgi:PIN domain nuclease of toxin-antitoxin system